MRPDPIEAEQRASHEARQRALDEAKRYLEKNCRGEVLEALLPRASDFLVLRLDDVGTSRYYDGRRVNQTWVLQTKEIDFIAKVSPIAGAIAAVAGPASLAVTVLASMAGVLVAFRSKKIELGERDFALVMFLKARGPVSETALLSGLNAMRARTTFTWNASGLAADLDRLQKVAAADGTIVAVVAQDGEKRWTANGI
jgi:hypothetical protein